MAWGWNVITHGKELARFANKNPLPEPLPDDATPQQGEAKAEELRGWTKKLTKHFKFKFPDERWCSKRASSGRPHATDVICTNPPLIGYDVVFSGGTRQQEVVYDPQIPGPIPEQVPIGVDDSDGWGPQDMVGDVIDVPVPEHVTKLFYTHFWALGGEREGWPELEEFLAEIKKEGGADGIRGPIIHLRGKQDDDHNPWLHIGHNLDDPNLEDDLNNLCNRVRRHGLKMWPVLTGGIVELESEAAQDRLVDRCCRVLVQHLDILELVEMANEYGRNGISLEMVQRMLLRCRRLLGPNVLLATSTPNASHMGGDLEAEVRAMQMHEANAMNVHVGRSHQTPNVPPNLGPFAPAARYSGEPRGLKSSVVEIDNPDDFVADYKACKEKKWAGYGPHSDAGVWGKDHITARYRIPNEQGVFRLFSSHPTGRAVMAALKQERGGSVVVEPPVPPAPKEWLESGASLEPSESIKSQDKRYELAFQPDCNLVFYGPDGAIWNSQTQNDGTVQVWIKDAVPLSLDMQGDGNLVLYVMPSGSDQPRAAWNSQTQGNPGAKLLVQNDGNVVIYDASGQPIRSVLDHDGRLP